MDGNYLLIKLVKKRPVLWNKTCKGHKNYAARQSAWQEIAERINLNITIDWLKSRWFNLRERFVKELKLLYRDNKPSKFRYFQQLMFLLKHVDFKSKLGSKFDEFLQKLSDSQKPQVEFIITMDDIENNDESDTEMLFEEIIENKLQNGKMTNENMAKLFGELFQSKIQCDKFDVDPIKIEGDSDDSPEEDEVENAIEIERVPQDLLEEEIEAEISTESVNDSSTENNYINMDTRCTDDIFGELVSSMLKDMDEDRKAVLKKQIINILFQ